MTTTTTNYAGIAEAFRAARELIAAGKESRICYALVDTKHSSELSARILIDQRLQGFVFLEDWLHKNALNYKGSPSRDEMRAYRLRWLDALIAEFEGYAREAAQPAKKPRRIRPIEPK